MYKLNQYIKNFLLVSLVGLLSCNSEEANRPPIVSTTKYLVALEANPIGLEAPVDYLVELSSIQDLSNGIIDAENKGKPQIGWRFFYQSSNVLYTAGYSDDVTCISYAINENKVLAEKAKFTFNKTLDTYANTEDNKLIAVQLSYSGFEKKRFHIVNNETGKIERIVEHEIDIDRGDGTPSNPGSIPWITGMVQRNNKLFISYHKWTADGSYKTPDTDQAYVAIFSYPEFTLEKIITDNRTSPIGTNGHTTGIIKTENNDIYSFSSSALSAGYTAASKPSGILKIKNNATEFDVDYFFDVENAPNGGKIFWMDYLGNGKAIARIIIDDSVKDDHWEAYTKLDVVKLVIIDLDAKTVTDVQGVPNPHGQRYTSPVFKENNKAFISVSNDQETRIYIVDSNTASATKGAKVNGKSLKGIFKLTQ